MVDSEDAGGSELEPTGGTEVAPTGGTEVAPTSGAEVAPTTTAAPPAPAEPARRVPRWRRILVVVCLVLSCVLAPISALAVWINHTLLNTDQYVATIGPLASNPAVQQAMADRVTTLVVENTNVETTVKNALPSRAAFIAPYVADGLEKFVHAAALRFVESDRWETLWTRVNRAAHTQVVAVLKGEGTKTISTKNGQIVLDLTPLANRVSKRLDALGVTVFDRSNSKFKNPKIVLIDNKSLGKAQSAVKLLDALAIVLPLLALALLAAAVALSPKRRKTLLHGAIAIAFSIGLTLVLFNLLRSVYLNQLPASVHQDAAEAIYDQLLTFLLTSLRVIFAVAVIVAIGAWVVGPGRYATKIREWVLGLVERKPDAVSGPVPTFVASHRSGLRVVVIALGLILLVALDHPGVVAVIIVAAIVLAALLLIEFLGGREKAPVTTS